MNYSEVQPIALAIMTSIITGGFVLVFVEIGNRKNRENDRHDGIMSPFIHKLSAYFRFMRCCHGQIIYPRELNGNEKEFRKLVDKMDRYGSRIIVSGGDYLIDSFSASQLYDIAFDINNIWYYHDKMRPCRLRWDGHVSYDGTDYIAKELKELNPLYVSAPQSVQLIAKVSSDFYTDVYLPIEYETYRHEAYLEQYNTHSIWVSICFLFVLVMLCLMLFVHLPVWALQASCVGVVLMLISSLLFLAVDVNVQVKWKGQLRKRKENRKTKREANLSRKRQRKA